MNIQKKIQRFFRVHGHSAGGFTLVELIVVIAILAILAGVAIPAYSGYIKKAQTAGDLQLLDAINTAFAVACLENGYAPNEVSTGNLPVKTDGTIGTFKTITADGKNITAAVQASFDIYFADNKTSTFKSFTLLTFDKEEGVFVASEGSGNMTQEQIQVQVDRYSTSNLFGNEDKLLESVETISDLLVDELDNINVADFMVEGDYEAFCAKYGITDETDKTEVANALVMYTASKTQGVKASDINVNDLDSVINEYGYIPTAAMMYGVISGYANSDYASDEFKASYQTPPTGVTDVLNLVSTMQNDPNFMDYYNNSGDKGLNADLDGYLAAMEIVNGHEDSFDLKNPDVFTDENANGLLNGILGK